MRFRMKEILLPIYDFISHWTQIEFLNLLDIYRKCVYKKKELGYSANSHFKHEISVKYYITCIKYDIIHQIHYGLSEYRDLLI